MFTGPLRGFNSKINIKDFRDEPAVLIKKEPDKNVDSCLDLRCNVFFKFEG
jgi:hypothetical protein